MQNDIRDCVRWMFHFFSFRSLIFFLLLALLVVMSFNKKVNLVIAIGWILLCVEGRTEWIEKKCGGHGWRSSARQFACEMDYIFLEARLRLIEIYIRQKVSLIY